MWPAHAAAALPQSSGTLLTPTAKELSARVSQVENDVGMLKKSFDHLRSEVGAATTTFKFSGARKATGGTTVTPLQSSMLEGAGHAREGSMRAQSTNASASVPSACESRTDDTIAKCFRRLSAQEAMCEDLRDTLQDRLEQFHAELEEKLKHLTPRNVGTKEHNYDAVIRMDASKQQSPRTLGGDNLSQTVASVYAILRTEVIQEVGQLRSFIESEVQRLCIQFEVQSAKVEQHIIIVSRSEATSNWLSQSVAEISQDVAKLHEDDVKSRSEVSELRSRLEVFVRECDGHISKEQGRQVHESAAFLSSLKQENDLSDRVQRLEKACQQSIAMPSVMLEAAESLRTELRQVVDPLREDVDRLKRASASSQPRDKEAEGLAESKHLECRSSHHEVNILHRRFSDLEAACATQSQKSAELQQHLGAVEQVLSQEIQKTCSTVNSQVGLVTQTVEFLRKEYVVVKEQINSLTDSVAHACANSILKAEALLSRELVLRESSNLATGADAIIATAVPLSRPLEEGQLKEAPQESKLERAIIGLQQMVAGTLMSRISAMESMLGMQLGSSTNLVAQSQAHSQVRRSVQPESTLASSRPAIASPTGRHTQLSLKATMPASHASVSSGFISRASVFPGISSRTSSLSSASLDVVKVLPRDASDMNVRKTNAGLARRQNDQSLQVKTVSIQKVRM